MTIAIIKSNLFQFTENIADKLNIPKPYQIKFLGKEYHLLSHPDGKKPIILLPEKILRKIPVAKCREDIEAIVNFNNQLREKYNKLFAQSWKEVRGKTAEQKRNLIYKKFFSDKENIKLFIQEYKKYQALPYDFKLDPNGEVIWSSAGKKLTEDFPLELSLKENPSITDVENVVVKIINQFKKSIELNGLNELLFKDGIKGKKPRNERNVQLLFYSVSDAYCEANNIDLNREPKPGIGQIDFKYSHGYELKFIVEIKLSTHAKLAEKYLNQLPRYLESEKASSGAFAVIQITDSKKKIKELQQTEKEQRQKNPNSPKVYLIDGRIKPFASKFISAVEK